MKEYVNLTDQQAMAVVTLIRTMAFEAAKADDSDQMDDCRRRFWRELAWIQDGVVTNIAPVALLMFPTPPPDLGRSAEQVHQALVALTDTAAFRPEWVA